MRCGIQFVGSFWKIRVIFINLWILGFGVQWWKASFSREHEIMLLSDTEPSTLKSKHWSRYAESSKTNQKIECRNPFCANIILFVLTFVVVSSHPRKHHHDWCCWYIFLRIFFLLLDPGLPPDRLCRGCIFAFGSISPGPLLPGF